MIISWVGRGLNLERAFLFWQHLSCCILSVSAYYFYQPSPMPIDGLLELAKFWGLWQYSSKATVNLSFSGSGSGPMRVVPEKEHWGIIAKFQGFLWAIHILLVKHMQRCPLGSCWNMLHLLWCSLLWGWWKESECMLFLS